MYMSHSLIKIVSGINLFNLKVFYVCILAYTYVCLYATCMPGTHRGQKRAFELELQKVVSWNVDARNQTWVLYKNCWCSAFNYWVIFLVKSPPHSHPKPPLLKKNLGSTLILAGFEFLDSLFFFLSLLSIPSLWYWFFSYSIGFFLWLGSTKLSALPKS